MKKALPIIIIALIIIGIGVVWKVARKDVPNPAVTDETKSGLIRVDSPRPGQEIQSPLVIKGEARGYWFFEATFPLVLTDWDGKIIAESYTTAKGEWMTSEFVPFEATLNFTVAKDVYSRRGTLVLRKSNASGLPEHDDAIEIPVVFATAVGTGSTPPPPKACTMEAKLCPDGSYVGRTGPNCEFTECPAPTKPISVPYNSDGSCPSGYVNYGIPLQCVTPEYSNYCHSNPCPL